MGCRMFFFFSSRRRHTRWTGDWSSDVCSSDLTVRPDGSGLRQVTHFGPRVNLLQNGSFSPDGAAIVFATTSGSIKKKHSNLPDIFTVGLDGSGLRPVTRSRNWDGSPDWGPAP